MAQYLKGDLKPPAVPRRAKNWARNFHIVSLAMACVHVFGLTKTRVDDGTSTDNACDVISTIISEFGGNVSYRAVKDLITGAKPENAKLRIEIAALMEITKRRREERPDLARLWDGLTPDRMTELDKQFRHD